MINSEDLWIRYSTKTIPESGEPVIVMTESGNIFFGHFGEDCVGRNYRLFEFDSYGNSKNILVYTNKPYVWINDQKYNITDKYKIKYYINLRNLFELTLPEDSAWFTLFEMRSALMHMTVCQVYRNPTAPHRTEIGNYVGDWICSNCGHSLGNTETQLSYDFCPHCGSAIRHITENEVDDKEESDE